MLYFKGFDENLCCRGVQFEVGKEYKIENDKPEELCTDSVFHFCRNIFQVHAFYSCFKGTKNRFCYIEALSPIVEDNEKCGCKKIRIISEILGKDLDILRNVGVDNIGVGNTGDYNTGYHNTGNRNTGDYNTGNHNTGYHNTGYRNTGNYNTGNHNTGNRNTGNHNTGYRNTGYYNTGDYNTDDYNTGYYNTGYRNTGDYNTGDYNTGNSNIGDRNIGDRNIGDRNIGVFNFCNYSTGIFCRKEPTIKIFDIDSGMTLEQFKDSKFWDALYSHPFNLIFWDEEQNKKVVRTFSEACSIWWANMSEMNREIIQSIPNFDKEIFKEITGIDVDAEQL